MLIKRYPFVILFALLLFSFSDIFLLKKTLNPFFLQNYGTEISNSIEKYNNFNNVDQGTSIFYEQPIKKFYGNNLKKLKYPFWNEHQSAGYPVYNQFSNNGLNPLYLVESLFNFKFYDLFIFLKLLMGSWGIFLLNRYLGQKNIYLIYISSLIYGLSAIFLWFNSLQQMIYFGAIFPYCLLFTIKSIDSKQIFISSILLNTLLNYLGQPEIAFYCFVFQTFFILSINLSSFKNFFIALKYILIIYGVSFLLSLPNIMPQLDWLNYADNSLHEPGGGSGIASPSPLIFLKVLFFPYISAIQTHSFYFPINGFWDTLGGYILYSLLIFSVLALLNINKCNRKLIIISCLLFILIINFKNFGIYPFYSIGNLPIFDQVWSNRWANISWITALSILIGNLQFKKISNNLLTLLLLITFIIGIIFFNWVLSVAPRGDEFIHGENFLKLNKDIINSHIISFSLFIIFSSYFIVYLFYKNHKKKYFLSTLIIYLNYLSIFPKEISPKIYLIQLIIFGSFILFVYFVKNIKYVYFLFIPIISIVVQAYDGGLPPNKDPFSSKNYINFLKKENKNYSRISGANGLLFGNMASAYEIDDISGIMALPSKLYSEHYWSNNNSLSKVIYHSKPPWFSGVSNFIYKNNNVYVDDSNNIANINYISDLSVRYIIFPKFNSFTKKNIPEYLSEIYKDKEVVIYENLLAKKRYSSIKKDYCNKIENNLYCNTSHYESLEILPSMHENDQIIFDGCELSDSYILTTDLYAPGWSSNHKILKYNNIFRAIDISDNNACESINMSYIPPNFKYSLLYFMFGILILFYIFVKKWYKF